MTFFVYISDACAVDAQQFGVTDHLAELALTIERDQAFWQLEAFEYPFWVKKRLGNRHTRLICRLESHHVGATLHHVLVCLRILQRGGREYEQLFTNIKKYGEDLYRQIDPAKVVAVLQQRCQDDHLTALPVPSTEENQFIYAVRSQYQHTELHHQRDMMYDSWSWVEQSATRFEESMLHEIADRLQQQLPELATAAQADDQSVLAYTLGEYVGYRVLLLWFAQHQLSYLTLEAINPQDNLPLSERHWSVEQLRAAADTASFEQFQQQISRTARRVYPQLVGWNAHDWLTLQHDQVANLALSPEEAEILNVTQQQERPFPLFINGRAGSGKSTILQCLFADYLHYALQNNTQSHPIYFSCNQQLADRAAEMVWQIVQHSCRYTDHHVAAIGSLNLHQMRQYCVEFRQFLYQQLSEAQRQRFAVGRLIEYGRFRQLWDDKFSRLRDAQQRYPASLCWHVIRCYIKGSDAGDYLEPEDYAELGQDLRHVPQELFELIYQKVWLGWYQPLCKQHQYWDDQDLVRELLQTERLQPQFPAIFCDESQDFTRLELQAILRLNLFSGRSIETHNIQRIPLVFAGDQFQTLNPTGFRWESVKAQVVEQFIFALDPAHQTRLSEISYRELTYNFRCSHAIAYFSNIIHGLRAKLFGLKQLQPQRSWHSHDGCRDVVFVDMDDPSLYLSLASQYDLVFVVPCVDGAELDYIRADPVLSVLIQIREQGGTSIPVLSVNRAKGLEFSRVVMYGFAQDCPKELQLDQNHTWSDGQKIHVEYYLNRLYVAATRARSQLLLLDRATDYQDFWSAFAHPLDAPLQLDQLQTEQADWVTHLGTLRRAELDDLTPDADQIRTMQKNAEQMQQQGWEQRDAYFLQQAANLYQQLGIGYESKQQQCLAQVDYLEQRFADAAVRFLQVEQPLWAFESYWRAQDWAQAYQMLQQQSLATTVRAEREFLALSQRDHVSPQAYINAAHALVLHLQSAQQAATTLLAEDLPNQTAWQQVVMHVLERLPMDAAGAIWREVYQVSQALNQQANFAGQIAPSYLAEFAYLADQMADACQHWEAARAELKIQPPTPRYEHAIIASRAFPDNLDALLKLQEYPQLYQAMLTHADPNTLNSKVWSSVVDALQQHDPVKLKQVLGQQLPLLTDMPLFDLLSTKLQALPMLNTLSKQIHKLKLLRACTEGHWAMVQAALDQLLPTHQQLRSPSDLQTLLNLPNPNKKQQKQLQFNPDPKLVLILQGLARSEPYSKMVIDDHLSNTAQGIMDTLKAMFQQTIPNPYPPVRRQAYAKHIKVWRTQFEQVRLLGSVLERSNNFIEALSFYEQLEKTDPEYAQQRWLACKLRQAEHSYRMRDDFLRKADDAVDHQKKQDYERRALEVEQRAEQHMKSAREQRKKLNFAAHDSLPEYPEMTTLSSLIQDVLNIQPTLPKPVTHAVTNAVTSADQLTADAVEAVTLAASAHLMPDPSITEASVDASVQTEGVDVLANTDVKTESEAEVQAVDQTAITQTPTPDLSIIQTNTAADIDESVDAEPVDIATQTPNVVVADLVTTTDMEVSAPVALVDSMVEAEAVPEADGQTVTATATKTATTHALIPDVMFTDTAADTDVLVQPTPAAQDMVLVATSGTPRISKQYEPTSSTAPEDTAIPAPTSTALPKLHQPAKLPKTELVWGDYRLTFMRVQQRLNIEHQLTGEFCSVFVQQARVSGDWALQPLAADTTDGYQLLGTPFVLYLPTALRTYCVVEVAAHGLQLVLR